MPTIVHWHKAWTCPFLFPSPTWIQNVPQGASGQPARWATWHSVWVLPYNRLLLHLVFSSPKVHARIHRWMNKEALEPLGHHPCVGCMHFLKHSDTATRIQASVEFSFSCLFSLEICYLSQVWWHTTVMASTPEADWVQGQSWLHFETLAQKKFFFF
jgi:hypothetical protein